MRTLLQELSGIGTFKERAFTKRFSSSAVSGSGCVLKTPDPALLNFVGCAIMG
jgi:hypothetical protein